MKSKKQFILFLVLFFLLSLLNLSRLSKDNQSLEWSINSLVKTANAQWEDPPGNGDPVICAFTTGSPSGFLYLICTSQYTCLYGYEVFVHLDECYYFG